MISRGLKNFFISLKYFFTPLGTMFLGIMIGISFFIPCVVSSIDALIKGIGALGESVNLNFNEVWNTLWVNITSLNWNEPNEALNTIFKVDWLNQTMTEILSTILGKDFEIFKQQIIDLVNEFSDGITIAFVVFLIWWIIGFIAGFILIRFQIRRKIARRNLWKYIVSVIFNALLSSVFIVFCTLFYLMWKPSIAISILVVLILVGFFSLLEAYLIHGRKIVSINSVVNLKNIGAFLITNTIIFLIALSFSLLIIIVNALLGIFVAMSLFEIAFLVISMNAESYVKELASKDSILQDKRIA